VLPDCLVVDIHMPPGGPHGVALANMLQLRKPDQLVIFVTGHPEAAADVRDLWGADSVFAKPVDFDQLATEIKGKVQRAALR